MINIFQHILQNHKKTLWIILLNEEFINKIIDKNIVLIYPKKFIKLHKIYKNIFI